MARLTHVWLCTALAVVACDPPRTAPPAVRPIVHTEASNDQARSSSEPAAPAGTATGEARAAPTAKPSSAAFVRQPTHYHAGADAIDGCIDIGGLYVGCHGAYYNAKDLVLKRYLLRLAQGWAGNRSDYRPVGKPIHRGEIAHAEVPYMCDASKPCDYVGQLGRYNAAINCLGRAYEAWLMHDVAAAKAAHRHACKCDPDQARIPAYIGSAAICDANNQPAFVAANVPTDVLADILLCGRCVPQEGPAACKREAERLRKTDPELARFIETAVVRRCQTPNDQPSPVASVFP